jgi:hypothetical protein
VLNCRAPKREHWKRRVKKSYDSVDLLSLNLWAWKLRLHANAKLWSLMCFPWLNIEGLKSISRRCRVDWWSSNLNVSVEKFNSIHKYLNKSGLKSCQNLFYQVCFMEIFPWVRKVFHSKWKENERKLYKTSEELERRRMKSAFR